MTKIIKAKYKISRRLGKSLWGTAKDPVHVKNSPPGHHAALGYKKSSDYGTQLKAKQQLKKYYGYITEKQFRRTYKKAANKKGDTSENLIGLLESRLDAIVYRANLAPTVFAARQLVSHKHVLVNGSICNIPSCEIKPGDIIEVKESSRQILPVLEATQKQERPIPDYLEVDLKACSAKYVRIPLLEDVPYPIVMEPNLVVEFYSR